MGLWSLGNIQNKEEGAVMMRNHGKKVALVGRRLSGNENLEAGSFCGGGTADGLAVAIPSGTASGSGGR